MSTASRCQSIEPPDMDEQRGRHTDGARGGEHGTKKNEPEGQRGTSKEMLHMQSIRKGGTIPTGRDRPIQRKKKGGNEVEKKKPNKGQRARSNGAEGARGHEYRRSNKGHRAFLDDWWGSLFQVRLPGKSKAGQRRKEEKQRANQAMAEESVGSRSKTGTTTGSMKGPSRGTPISGRQSEREGRTEAGKQWLRAGAVWATPYHVASKLEDSRTRTGKQPAFGGPRKLHWRG